jgi:anion-transporting  ArsA/GET3 family ATPase
VIGERIDGHRVIVCVGAGGVGKTTVSAALALGLAVEGRRVAVVTIDPARRLADALGLDELGNEPHLVDPARFAGHGVEIADGGELWAMMLDPKHTFDDLIEQLAPDERSRDEILANRIYQQLSSAVAGSQEFTAIAKLYELHVSGRFDVLVLDTPPSRNALDFLDAPDRLLGFLEGKALRTLLAPTGLAARVMGRGTGMVFGVLQKLTGVDLLADLSVFFRALGGLLDGFRQRAAAVKALLADPTTTFLIVSSPRREPVDEAVFFAGRLAESGMELGGVIVNRVTPPGGLDEEPAAVEDALRDRLGGALAHKVAAGYADARAMAAREAALIERLRTETGDPDPLLVAQLGGDVHDVDGLVRVCAELF